MKRLLAGEVSIFCEQLEMIVKAGIPISEGISMMKEELNEKELYEWLSCIEKALEEGDKFYEALHRVGGVPHYLIHMLTVGFESGKMEEVLGLLAKYYQKEEEIKQSVRRILFYPLVLLGIISVVIGIITTQVMPIFQEILESLGMQMSGIAMGTMQIGTIIAKGAVVAILVVLISGIGMAVYMKGKGKVDWMERRLMKSKVYEKIALQRFTSSMELMIGSGMDMEYSLCIAKEMVEHEGVRSKITWCLDRVRDGQSFIDVLSEVGLFSNLSTRMLIMGNKTGCLEEVMGKLARYYEEDVEVHLERILMYIEPIVIVILAGLIGSILLSVMLPLMSIMSVIG